MGRNREKRISSIFALLEGPFFVSKIQRRSWLTGQSRILAQFLLRNSFRHFEPRIAEQIHVPVSDIKVQILVLVLRLLIVRMAVCPVEVHEIQSSWSKRARKMAHHRPVSSLRKGACFPRSGKTLGIIINLRSFFLFLLFLASHAGGGD